MIMVKVGDKVRFLNAVGGGIVRRIDRDVVLVEEEDGFETPVLARECVVIESGRKQDNDIVPTDKQEIARRTARQVTPQPADDDDEPELPLVETRKGERVSLYLAFVPESCSRLGSTTFDAYLINDSNYYLDYLYAGSDETGEWTMYSRGTVEPNVQVHLESFGQESVNRFGRISVQAVAYKRGKSYACKEPVSTVLRIDPVKFYKLHTFGPSEFFEEKAWVLPLIENDLPTGDIPVDAKSLERAMQEKKVPQPQTHKPARHKQPKEGPVEVDLHIHELVDTTAGMSNADMLQLQLQTFRDTLDRYKSEKGRKIVFIHGKGDGVLRRAILEELQRKYKNYEYQDASFREYGFGATQVTIR